MPRFETLEEAFAHIRANPRQYLARVSLRTLQAYWDGYTFIDGGRYGDLLLSRGFNAFVDERYKNRASLNAISVIELYSTSDEEAWNRYFSLLDAFNSGRPLDDEEFSAGEDIVADIDFERLLLAILARPAMYFGTRRFDLLVAFINGWFRRSVDFEREPTSYERRFKLMESYIEQDINLPGPRWHSIIWFWSQSDDRAFEIFAGYVDEYLTQGKGWIKQIEASMERRRAGIL